MQDAVAFLNERNRDDAFFMVVMEKLSQVGLIADSFTI